ncbi:MAG: DUF1573 domain-containing protein [Flavobacteriaceae bacterium]|nr:DUF1573 domain-containing protein [Flavobacteriaceae bacterium]
MKHLLVVLFSFLCLSAYAQDGAQIEFKETTIDYGNAVVGEDDGIRHFEFKNTGNAPLLITKVYSTCGCTVPKKPEGPIAPGETGVIEVKYDVSKKRKGPIRKTITVNSNAVNVEEGLVSLKIKGKVIVN